MDVKRHHRLTRDISAVTSGAVFQHILLIYGLGITLLASSASDYVNSGYMRNRNAPILRSSIKWDDYAKNILLIINTPKYDFRRF